MRPISSLLRTLLLAGAATGIGLAAASADDETHWRLFVADHTDPVVRAIEVEDGSEAGRFPLDTHASLYRTSSGRSVFAVQGDAGKVSVIGTGITIGDHGDHADLDVEEPALLSTVLTGEKPAHFVENDGRIAMFYDGEGRVEMFAERQVLESELNPVVLDVGAPHHGLAIAFGDFVIHSIPDPEDPTRRPVGLRVVDGEGAQVGEDVACPGLHGQAASGRSVAFGCHDGVVIAVSGGGDGPDMQHVSTLELGEGNVSTLRGGTALQFFLGNYGQRAVVLFEPGSEASFRKIDLPTRRVDFAIDSAKARNAYVFTEDGNLHLIDVLSGTIEKSLQLTEPYSMDGHWRDPRPRIAVAGDHIAVTDPLKGLVRLVNVERFEEERAIETGGVPFTIVAVGGSGRHHD